VQVSLTVTVTWSASAPGWALLVVVTSHFGGTNPSPGRSQVRISPWTRLSSWLRSGASAFAISAAVGVR
jgi:hypothetical protein